MGKRHRDETKEERKERKRAKKEAKMQKGANNENDQTPSNNNVHQQASLSPIIQPTGAVSPSTPTTKSPFQEKRLKMMVSLYPVALSNVLSHVREALRRSLLLKFSDGVGGVLLGFENVTFSEKKRLGMILNEFPQVHYTVELDALIFCPEEIGSKLTGVVNECFPSHVGMLVHSYFNAMVSSDQMESAGYVFDTQTQQWMQESDSKVLGNGDMVDFIVEKMHECDGIISMEGSSPRVK